MKKMLKKSMLVLIVVSIVMTLFAGAALADTVKGVGGSTNIRKGPGTNYKVIGSFPKGASATWKDTADDENDRDVTWYQITYKGVTGWVSSMYTSKDGEKTYNQTNGNLWTTGSVRMRSEGSLDAKIICTIPKGERVNKLSDEREADDRGVYWYRVSWGTKTGWVSAAYLSTKYNGSSISKAPKNDSSSSSSSSSGTKVKATGGNTNIRNKPNLSGKDIGTLPKGASAKYISKSEPDERGVVWYKISYKGVTGWVSSKYTTKK